MLLFKVWRIIILSIVSYAYACACHIQEEMKAGGGLRRIFGFEWGEKTGYWRRLHNEELFGLYASNIVGVIKSRIVSWEGHVHMVGRGQVHAGFWRGNVTERDNFDDQGVDRKIILK